jgi:hypothetical protein
MLRAIECVAQGTFVTQFAVIRVATINDILTVKNTVTEIAILTRKCPDDQIAIFVFGGVVGIERILALCILNGGFRHCQVEIMKLLKKIPGKIIRPAVCKGIILITPPHFLIVDGIGRVWRIERYDILPRLVAFSRKERSFVSKHVLTL